jgi:hypothetical protein
MKLTIKKLDNKREEIEVSEQDTIGKLKQKLADKVGIAVSQIRLIFKGQILENSAMIKDCSLVHGDVVHMVLEMRG